MTFRVLSLLAFCAMLAAVAAAVWLYLREPSDEPGLVVEQSERTLDSLTIGRDYDVEFRVVNRTGRTRRIVGADDAWCGHTCCYRVKQELPLDVPACGSATVSFVVTARAPGEFRDRIRLFVDDGFMREIPLSVQGTVVRTETDKSGTRSSGGE